MFKPGQLVRIKDVRKGALSVSYVPVYVIENDQRATEEHKNTYSGLTYRRNKMKKLPLHSICLFIKEDKETLSHLLHEDQIIECYTDWIEPL
jgi:hypothetical protein